MIGRSDRCGRSQGARRLHLPANAEIGTCQPRAGEVHRPPFHDVSTAIQLRSHWAFDRAARRPAAPGSTAGIRPPSKSALN